jgi:hypothetical protein
VTHVELTGGGLSRQAIAKRVRGGALVRRFPGVYSYGPGELSREALWLAATLAVGEGAALGHLSVGELLQVSRRRAALPHVVVPRRHQPIDGIVIHESRTLHPQDVTTWRGMPVTTVARMLVDLADTSTPHQLANVMHDAAYRRRLHLGELEAALARANGRRGVARVRRAIELHRSGCPGTKSDLEDALLALVPAAGLPEPLVNLRVEGVEVDFHWPDRGLIVEADGPHHLRPAVRLADARRDERLRAAGWTVLRFWDLEIERRPDEVVRAIAVFA